VEEVAARIGDVGKETDNEVEVPRGHPAEEAVPEAIAALENVFPGPL
jgi:hypothetical protein